MLIKKLTSSWETGWYTVGSLSVRLVCAYMDACTTFFQLEIVAIMNFAIDIMKSGVSGVNIGIYAPTVRLRTDDLRRYCW